MSHRSATLALAQEQGVRKSGKYSAMRDEVFNRTCAEGAVVVIYNGDKGNGFSAVGSPDFLPGLPKVLRLMADQMEAEDKVRQKLLC